MPPSISGLEVRIFFKSMDILALALERGDVGVFYNYAASYPYYYLIKLVNEL